MLRSLPRLLTLAALMTALAGLIGCNRGKAPPPPMPPPPVTVTKPVLYPVQSYYEYNGYLDAVETVQIRARVKGFLTEILFKEGKEVPAGKLLYTIDPREYDASLAKSQADIKKAEADIANANAQIQLAEAELARQQKAYSQGATPKTDLDKAIATLAANRAQLDVSIANKAAAESSRDTAQLQLDYTKIYSPIAGRISRTQVTKGNLIGQSETTLLTTIVTVDPLYVYFDVPERDLIERQPGHGTRPPGSSSERTPRVEVGVGSEEGYPHVGPIDFQENRADTGTGTVRIRGLIPNPVLRSDPGMAAVSSDGSTPSRKLYPGLFARVRVPIGDASPRPVIPEDALMTGQEGRFVYVVGADNKVVKRTVTVGTQVYRIPPSQAGQPAEWMLTNPTPAPPPQGAPPPPAKTPVRSVVAIVKGLSTDDVIIVDGLQKARPGGEVTPEMRTLSGPPPK